MDITTPDQYFETVLPAMAEEKPELLKGLTVVAQWNIQGEEPGVWTTVVENGKLSCKKEKAKDPEIVVDIAGEDLLEIYRGELKPTTAYMTKRLKLTGDIEKALKLAKLLQEEKI